MFHASVIIRGHPDPPLARGSRTRSRTMKRHPADVRRRVEQSRRPDGAAEVEGFGVPYVALYLRPPWPRKSTPCQHRRLPTSPEFRRRLLRWFRRHGRDLPWRRTRDPYRVLVSEFMLQQTQVSRVEAYYHRFLERYPVVQRWPRRRRRRCGRAGRGSATTGGRPTCTGWRRTVVREHGGRDSRTIPELLRRLPGVGPLHRGRGRELRLRARDAGGGHQRGAGDPAGVPSPARRPARSGSGRRRRRWCPGGASRVGVQSGDHGAGRAGLYGAGGALRRVSGAAGVRHRGRRAERDAGGARSSVPHHRPGHQRHQPEHPRDRRHHPLPLAQLVEVRRRRARRVEPGRACAAVGSATSSVSSAPTSPAPCITMSHRLKPTSSPMRPVTEKRQHEPGQHGEQRARRDERPLDRRLRPHHGAERRRGPPAWRRSPATIEASAAAEPHREAEQVEEEPESDHERTAERMAPSIGWRPAKPASISCQWVMRVLAQPPAEEDRPVLAQRVEVHQPRLESLEDAADRLELLQVVVDPVGVRGRPSSRAATSSPVSPQSARAPPVSSSNLATAARQRGILGREVLPRSAGPAAACARPPRG